MSDGADALLSEENLERAQRLVREIQAGNRDSVLEIVSDLSSTRDSALFQSVGKLTRNLHDSVSNLGADSPDELFDAQKFPDARERLNHVIKLTEDSANTTLNIVEETMPLVQECGEHAAELQQRWEKLCTKQLDLQSFRELSVEINDYFSQVQRTADRLQSHLGEVLMAQGFQDLTGQMIRQVINLVDDVEHQLVDLVSMTGGITLGSEEKSAEEERDAMMKGQGPALPSASNDVMKNQDDVDDLLASLGF
ncbi:MAG: protein phosphatase CheZ [Pseudomonadota bacterium]